MPNSLRCKIKSQVHKGLLSEKEGQRLIKALDIVDAKCGNCKYYNQYCFCNKAEYWCGKMPYWTKCNDFEKRSKEV